MENTMKKYKVIALSALIAAGFTSCELTEKPKIGRASCRERV